MASTKTAMFRVNKQAKKTANRPMLETTRRKFRPKCNLQNSSR